MHSDYRLVLVRRGWFRRSTAGVPADLDPTLAYFGVPDEEECFAHPAGGDVCTSLSLTPELWRVLVGDLARLNRPTVYVDARIDLSHRRFLAAARSGDVEYALIEELVRLLDGAVEQVLAGPKPTGVAGGDGAVVGAARQAIRDGHPAAEGLLPLAELLGVSPYRLSRAFSRDMGTSLTRHRNRVRVGRAMDRLEGGERSLAVLAADLGFADQAHLSRTIRAHVGHTPTALRRLLLLSPHSVRQ